MKFANLKRKLKAEEEPTIPTVELTKEECLTILSLIVESNIKIKDIQHVYDLIFKLQEFIQKDQ
jgi:hypothetical protein